MTSLTLETSRLPSLRPFGRLLRVKVSAMVAGSAVAGSLLHSRSRPEVLLSLAFGIFLLASGCSALNQVQERDLDARMARTQNRPLPAGQLTPAAALGAAVGFMLTGLALLGAFQGWTVALLGLFSFFWYNGIYTSLKRRTSLAILPGAVCGALPPVMGWVGAGGHPLDFQILVLGGIFLLWQIPHFVLFSLMHQQDYRAAGLPTLPELFRPRQIRSILLAWIAALAVSAPLLPILALPVPFFPRLLWVLSIPILLAFWSIRFFRQRDGASPFLFQRLNLLMASMTVSMIAGRLLA